eukprot:6157041-Alexandrium_andersonii.AAC.1
MAVRNIAILAQASGRQMIHTLWRVNDRRADQSELQATLPLGSVMWGPDTFEGIEKFYTDWLHH